MKRLREPIERGRRRSLSEQRYRERELAKILARDNELRDAEASEKRKQEAAVAAAVIEWESRVEKVLLPAIEPLAAMLKGAGWTCDIERTPQGFKVGAFAGDMVGHGSRDGPSLSLQLQKGKRYLRWLERRAPVSDAKIGGLAYLPARTEANTYADGADTDAYARAIAATIVAGSSIVAGCIAITIPIDHASTATSAVAAAKFVADQSNIFDAVIGQHREALC